MYKGKIKNSIEKNKDDILDLWARIVNIDSGSYNKDGVDKVALVLKNELDSLGFNTKIVEMKKAGNTLVGTWNEESNKEPIIFMGHMDTVFSSKESKERPFLIKDDKAFGPGVLDMKGGLVIGIFAAKALIESGYNKRPIKVIYLGDEEVAHINSNAVELIKREADKAKACLNFESGRLNNEVVVSRMGTRDFKVKIQGVAAHSGNDPEMGRSAIVQGANLVIELEKLNDIKRGKLINCGLIKGGISTNTIPDSCEIGILTRYKTREIGEEILKDIKEVLSKTFVEGTKTEFETKVGIGPMEKTDEVMGLFNLLSEVNEKLGNKKLVPIEVGGGSDAAFTSEIKIPTVCALGVVGEFNHTDKEYAVVDTMYERIELAANTVYELD